jgi:hypothetical protein
LRVSPTKIYQVVFVIVVVVVDMAANDHVRS